MSITLGAKPVESKYAIVVSYQEEDADRIKKIIPEIKGAIWYCSDLESEKQLGNLGAHLRNCPFVIAFLSQNVLSTENSQVMLDTRYAKGAGKDVLFVHLEHINRIMVPEYNRNWYRNIVFEQNIVFESDDSIEKIPEKINECIRYSLFDELE